MPHRPFTLLLLVATCGAGLAQPPAAPAPTADPLRRIAFGSCVHQDKPQPIWDAVNALRPDVFLFLGDNIYADTDDMEVMKAKYEKQAAVPGFQKLKAQCRLLATWDDHDYGKNDAGVEYPKKKESQQLFLDFLGVPKDSPRRSQDGVYSAEVFGPPSQRVQIILLDTRCFRGPLKKKATKDQVKDQGPYEPNPDLKASMLGEAQWKWLEEQLKVPARLRLIGSSIQLVAEDHGWEKWMNLPHERARFFKLVKETKAEGIVILSGDRHLAEISMMDAGLGYPLFDATSSGLTEAFKAHRPHEANRHRVGTMNFGDNFGLVTIDWHKPDPIVALQIRDVDGDVRLSQKLPLSLLNPHAAKEVAKPGNETPPPAGVLTPAEAAKQVGKTVTVEFVVKATGGTGSRVFINSEESFRDENNFTVVLERTLPAKITAKLGQEPKAALLKKKIRVTGKVEMFQGKAQIKLDAPEHLAIIE